MPFPLASIILITLVRNTKVPQTTQSIQLAPIVDNTVEVDPLNINYEAQQVTIEIEEDKSEREENISTDTLLKCATVKVKILEKSIDYPEKKLSKLIERENVRHREKKAEKKPLRFG